MEHIRELLVDLIDRIDSKTLERDDLFALGMVAMAMKKQKSQQPLASDDTDALRCLTLGWLVDGMLTVESNTPKNDN